MKDADPDRVRSWEGPAAALLRIVSSTTRDRLDLVTLEFKEEKRKYLALLGWGALAVIVGMQAILLTNLVILYLVPFELRPWVAVALVALNWLLVVWAMMAARARLAETGRPFQTTWEQLQKDMECLKSDD
jgi:uncharacterized membrane protein YqjE